MNNEQTIKLNPDEKAEFIGLIKTFFQSERGEEIGDLQATVILDFVVEKLSDKFYNKGIYDAYTYMSDRSSDLLGLQK